MLILTVICMSMMLQSYILSITTETKGLKVRRRNLRGFNRTFFQ